MDLKGNLILNRDNDVKFIHSYVIALSKMVPVYFIVNQVESRLPVIGKTVIGKGTSTMDRFMVLIDFENSNWSFPI